MNYAQLIQLYFERSTALQWYWTLYVVVIGGLLAFSTFRVRRDFLTTLLITVLFCGFAYKNLGAIEETSTQRIATLEAIKQRPAVEAEPVRDLLEPTLVTPAVEGVRNFHVVCDVLTVGVIWAKERRRRRRNTLQ